jgi:hypothetical protein
MLLPRLSFMMLIKLNTKFSLPTSPTDQLAYIPKVTLKHDPDYKQLHPFFGWLASDIIKTTFEHTTQFVHSPAGTTLKKAFKSPNLILNVYHYNGDIACDIVYSDAPAVCDGATAAVIFVGANTQVSMVSKRTPHF